MFFDSLADMNEALCKVLGDAVKSKARRAQFNETLGQMFCHNVCCLIQAMFELNLKPKSYAQMA
jgi:hypothetical protein